MKMRFTLFLMLLIFSYQIVIPTAHVGVIKEYNECVAVEKWILKQNPNIIKNPNHYREIREYVILTRDYCYKYNIDKWTMYAQDLHESMKFYKMNHLLKGGKGEIGVKQIMRKTGRDMGYSPEKLKKLKYNIECGTKLFRDNYKRFKNERKALAYYNGGKFWKCNDSQRYVRKILKIKENLMIFVGVKS